MELHKAPDQPFAVPVTRRSPEWGWLEYLLHASCAKAIILDHSSILGAVRGLTQI